MPRFVERVDGVGSRRHQPLHVFRIIRRNQARPFPPVIGYGAETLTRRSRWHVKASYVSGSLTTSLRSYTHWSRWPAAAALEGNDTWAARILGVRDAVAERTNATLVDRSVHDVTVEQVVHVLRRRILVHRMWAALGRVLRTRPHPRTF